MQSEPSFWAQQGRGFRRGAPGMESSWGWMHSRMEESTLIDDVLILNESPLLGGRRQSTMNGRFMRSPRQQRERSSLNPARWRGNMLVDEVVILDDRSAAPRGAADLIRWRSHLLPGMGPSEGEQQTAVLSSGLNEEMALLLLRTRRYVPSSTAYASDETCCICQEDYDEGEDVGMLSCGHGFHAACVGRWLTQRNVCPICRRTGLQPAV